VTDSSSTRMEKKIEIEIEIKQGSKGF